MATKEKNKPNPPMVVVNPTPPQPTETTIKTRVVNAEIVRGGQSYPLVFNLAPEMPSLSAASALSEMRKVLKKLLKPNAVAKLSDEFLVLMEKSDKFSLKDVMKKLLPMLQGSNIQERLYGESLEVRGSAYVEDTLAKELKGASIHLGILFEAIKEDPLVIAKFVPMMFGADKDPVKHETREHNGMDTQWM